MFSLHLSIKCFGTPCSCSSFKIIKEVENTLYLEIPSPTINSTHTSMCVHHNSVRILHDSCSYLPHHPLHWLLHLFSGCSQYTLQISTLQTSPFHHNNRDLNYLLCTRINWTGPNTTILQAVSLPSF